MTTMAEELDVVALLTDRPDLGLKKGDRGTVVMTLGETGLLVEFADDNGVERATPSLDVREVEVVWRIADHRTSVDGSDRGGRRAAG